VIEDITTTEEESGSIFESFSDVSLCTLAVALLLVALLAISISQKLNVEVNRSKFSGGLMRPMLYMECTVPQFSKTTSDELAVERALFSDTPYVAVHLFSPSLADIATEVRDGGTVAMSENETFSMQQDVPLYQFMQLAPGIDPGAFRANGMNTALLLPSILEKHMVYEPGRGKDGYRAEPDMEMAQRVLSSLWPIYRNPVFRTRQPNEYKNARTRILVETKAVPNPGGGEDHYVIIGHSAYKLPEALNDGSLSWLSAFSSGLTEIVFLGEATQNDEMRTNNRIQFFEENGFADCAEAYREYAFPSGENPELGAIKTKLIQLNYEKARIDVRARQALAQRKSSRALIDGTLADNRAGVFPPLLAFPEAWAAYVAHFEEQQPEPPDWFYSEFLDQLGFDRLAIEGLAKK